ncbi:hypothetical protein V2J09_000427 [Rumex salicifolius]
MNGAAVTSMEMTPPVTPPIASPGVSNAIRLVAQSLARCAQHKSGNEDSFSELCITLSRGLDYAIAIKEVPAQVSELPTIFKLVCQRRNECSLQAAIMVLMVTVKNACKAQWFSIQESQELLSLADEMVGFFCTTKEFSCEQENIIPTVSKIMFRYYPHIKLGDILVSFAIKPGFEACAVDFYIPKILNRAATERINLLVAMKDNIDTSSCIINPPKVNILLNGVGLQGRVVGCMYQGPQLPTNVNTMLRYGTNLVQVIGQFDDLPSPHDYHQPPAAAVDSGTI